jgi:ferritin-like metal-binding protein YciE
MAVMNAPWGFGGSLFDVGARRKRVSCAPQQPVPAHRPELIVGISRSDKVCGLQGTVRHGRAHSQSRRDAAMGIFTKDIKTLDDLFVHTLKDIYYAEKQILKALPKMIQLATNAQLKQGLESHRRETESHVQRLEQVFKMHGVEAKAVDCPAIDGIIKEANEITGDIADKEVCDAAIVAAAQAVEHYEITRYGTLIEWAKQLGRTDCASVLVPTLNEEKAADEKLTKLAEGGINRKAA